MPSPLRIQEPLPLRCGAVIPNRLAKAALSEALADVGNDVSEGLIDLYRRWAEGGAGLLIGGHTAIDRLHLEHAANVVLDDSTDLGRYRRLAAAGTSGEALLLAQLCHAGRQTPENVNERPLSLSPVRLQLDGYAEPREATDLELEEVVQQFARSAELALAAGFNGIEVHSAHGYLLSSSLSPATNRRSDRWGGPLKGRASLLLAIVRAVRAVADGDRVLAVKLNSADFHRGGLTSEDSVQVACWLEDEGIDLLELSGGTFERPNAYQYQSRKTSTRIREAWFLQYARAIKQRASVPLMVTGGFRSLDVMERALAEGATDLIGMGRPFVLDTDFPGRMLAGTLSQAPARERDFADSSELPAGAVLNWFCHQLTEQGRKDSVDPQLPVLAGHEGYLAYREEAARRWQEARYASPQSPSEDRALG